MVMNFTDADKAYTQIKEKIITVEMSPGSLILENQLMEELNLGRTPIREALKRLEQENLVIVVPRRGMFVAEIAITDIQQIYEVRVELEALCARLAAERATPAQLAEMRNVAAEIRAVGSGDKKRLMSLDRRSHHLLAQAAGNKFLHDEFELFYNLSLRIWYLSLYRLPTSETLGVEAHVRILEAIEARDGVRAEQEMREHIQHFHDLIKIYL
jgi:DNA-binding GntR family transcriptional regulator